MLPFVVSLSNSMWNRDSKRKIVTTQKKGGCYSSINETSEHLKRRTFQHDAINWWYLTRTKWLSSSKLVRYCCHVSYGGVLALWVKTTIRNIFSSAKRSPLWNLDRTLTGVLTCRCKRVLFIEVHTSRFHGTHHWFEVVWGSCPRSVESGHQRFSVGVSLKVTASLLVITCTVRWIDGHNNRWWKIQFLYCRWSAYTTRPTAGTKKTPPWMVVEFYRVQSSFQTSLQREQTGEKRSYFGFFDEQDTWQVSRSSNFLSEWFLLLKKDWAV